MDVNKKDKLRKAVLILCIGIFLLSSYQVISGIWEYRQGDSEYESLQNLVFQTSEAVTEQSQEITGRQPETAENQPETTESQQEGTTTRETVETTPEETTEEETTEPQMQYVDFATLTSMNPDAKGWLRLYGTKVNYPVVQTSDNSYYLNHTFQGTENKAGALFIDYHITEGMAARNIIIYGHNMQNGAMFGTLVYYKNPSMIENYPAFMLYTENGNYECAVFAAYMTTATSDTYTYGFASDETFLSYIDRMKAQSLYDTGVTVAADDRIVTLSTCSGGEEERFVVQAKIVK